MVFLTFSVEIILKLVATAIVGMTGLWAGIPAGLALGLSPLLSGAATATGTISGVTLIAASADRVKRRALLSRGGLPKRHRRLEGVWDAYGAAGVAMVSPLLTGAPAGMLLSLLLGAPPWRLLRWMVLGILAWTVLLTAAAALGLEVFQSLPLMRRLF